MSELSALAGSERYGTCDDDAQGETPWPERSDERRRDIRMSPPPSLADRTYICGSKMYRSAPSSGPYR